MFVGGWIQGSSEVVWRLLRSCFWIYQKFFRAQKLANVSQIWPLKTSQKFSVFGRLLRSVWASEFANVSRFLFLKTSEKFSAACQKTSEKSFLHFSEVAFSLLSSCVYGHEVERQEPFLSTCTGV